jgi:anti-anti-sigma factor
VVELDGDADLAAVPQLNQILSRTIETIDASGIVVDLDALNVLDDAALGQLVGAAATARRRDLSFALVCTNERLLRRMRDTRLDQIIDIVDRPWT